MCVLDGYCRVMVQDSRRVAGSNRHRPGTHSIGRWLATHRNLKLVWPLGKNALNCPSRFVLKGGNFTSIWSVGHHWQRNLVRNSYIGGGSYVQNIMIIDRILRELTALSQDRKLPFESYFHCFLVLC